LRISSMTAWAYLLNTSSISVIFWISVKVFKSFVSSAFAKLYSLLSSSISEINIFSMNSGPSKRSKSCMTFGWKGGHSSIHLQVGQTIRKLV
jgi:hypothetical protein